MSIANYSDLQSAVINWMNNSVLSAYSADLIMLGQSRIFRKLRIKAMETALNVTIADTTAPLPSDYLELKNAYVNSNPTRKLKRSTPDALYEMYPVVSWQLGIPGFIARVGEVFMFAPTPDSDYVIKGIYYAQPTFLSVDNPTNYYSANTPDLLLFAALAEAAPFLQDDARVALWEAKYQTIFKDIQNADKMEFGSPGDLRMSYVPY